MSTKRRVVVTGMGAISPIGSTLDDIWAALSTGQSGIKTIVSETPDDLTCRIAGQIPDFNPDDYMDKKDAKRMDRFMQFGMAASRIAYDHANFKTEFDRERFGVILGSGAGGMGTIETQLRRALALGFNKISPFFVPMMLPDSGAGRVSIELQAKGPNKAVVTACSTGADCIGEGFESVRNGHAEIILAGGAEAPIVPIAIGGFAAARALSQNDADPTKASRPFDKARDGFVMGEGSGMLVLEELEHAKARGAKIYAELVGYGCSSDAHDIVAPCSDGDGAARAMLMAFKSSGLNPNDIQYVNAHGTSTPLGDVAETLAIKRIFGDYAKNGLLVSSTKSMHGHLLGGAGSLEAIVCILAMLNNTVPPTINLDNPDEQCDLDYVAHTARPVQDLHTVMSNSFGFGGHNTSLIFRKFTA